MAHIPLQRPGKVIGIAFNYVPEGKQRRATPGLGWVRPPSSLSGDGDEVRIPAGATHVLAEPELAVVIGERVSRVDIKDAEQAILGFTLLNDLTAWELYESDPFKQFTSAKLPDTLCPIASTLATGIDPYAELGIWARINGETVLEGSTSRYAFTPAEAVSFVSQMCTLEPGDLIALGSPPGPPPVRPGDEVECEIEGIGTLRNRVAD